MPEFEGFFEAARGGWESAMELVEQRREEQEREGCENEPVFQTREFVAVAEEVIELIEKGAIAGLKLSLSVVGVSMEEEVEVGSLSEAGVPKGGVVVTTKQQHQN